jgi:hypothetical protein
MNLKSTRASWSIMYSFGGAGRVRGNAVIFVFSRLLDHLLTLTSSGVVIDSRTLACWRDGRTLDRFLLRNSGD